MESRQPSQFPPGMPLEKALSRAMERISASGVQYPDGWFDRLVRKYSRTGIAYPFALIMAGTPRLAGHFAYARALQQEGLFLDYGCGCGDSVRALIRAGVSRDRIRAYDPDPSVVGLGFDLYRDRAETCGLFTVSRQFPFRTREFGCVFSTLVLPCLGDDREFWEYLGNARAALRPGGIFFGTTMGHYLPVESRHPQSRLERVMTAARFAECLAQAGFTRVEIVGEPVVRTFPASLVRAGAAVPVVRNALRQVFARFPGINNCNLFVIHFCAVKEAAPEDAGSWSGITGQP